MPFLPNCFASSFAASSSSCGIRRGSISMIVTSLPNVLKIEANSQPMMPPPRMARRFGISVCASSPVESTQRSESRPGIGGLIGNEPVAMIAERKVDLSAARDRKRVRVLEGARALHPLDAVCLQELCDAAGHLRDDGGLPLVRRCEVELRLATMTPSFGNDSRAWWRKCAVCTQALVGMHPTRRQVPPSSGSFSMQTTVAPSCAARIAAVYPPGPPPRTATSHVHLPPDRDRCCASRCRQVRMQLEGIHHVTAITGDAPANVDFYAGVLGLRLVKKTVNQDDPTVYHLFYADENGSAGSDITFFEYPGAPRGRAGDGMVHRVVFRVGSEESLDFWAARVGGERGVGSLVFDDPEGLELELVVDDSGDPPLVARSPEIPAEHALARVRRGARIRERS